MTRGYLDEDEVDDQREVFTPYIEQILSQQYHNCVQGKRAVTEYTGEFLRLQARCNLRETEEQTRLGGEDGSRMLMGGRPNQSQLILPSTTNTTSSSNASGSGVDKNKKIQSVNSNSYDKPTGLIGDDTFREEEDFGRRGGTSQICHPTDLSCENLMSKADT
ncbi:hypothetical protein Tco_0264537 [Tanacetum coccineum]